MPAPSRRRFLRGLLQLVFCIGGLGYMFSGLWKKGLITFVLVLLCDLLVYMAGGEGRLLAALGLGFAFLIQILSALDLWLEEDALESAPST